MTRSREREILQNEILQPIGAAADRLPSGSLTAFLAMRGAAYDRRLMIVGRAVNGWHHGITPQDLTREEAVRDFSSGVEQASLGSGRCPMRWVTDHWGLGGGEYDTNRSPFWRVVCRVVSNLGIANVDQPDWPSHLVWSNLYKVAPFDGGNPGDRLCVIQQDGCKTLFQHELALHRPEKILFMTGMNWAAPFVEGSDIESGDGRHFVEATGRLSLDDGSDSRFVVACHPQTRPEDDWVTEVTATLGT